MVHGCISCESIPKINSLFSTHPKNQFAAAFGGKTTNIKHG